MKRSRKILSLIMTVAMVFTALPGTGIFWSYAEEAAGYTVSMSSNGGEVTAGDEFDVTLSVSSGTEGAEVAALHSVVEYDASKVEFVKASAPTSTPTGKDLNVAANYKDGAVTVESYGDSQRASSDGGAAMAVLKFKAKDGASGSAAFSLSAEQSFIGRSGDSADIKATEGAELSVTVKGPEVEKNYIRFGIENDGLTWTLLTVNGQEVNKEYRGGETADGVLNWLNENTVTFKVAADEGIQYLNVRQHLINGSAGEQFNSLNEENGIYTLRSKYGRSIAIDASTLEVYPQDECDVDAELSQVADNRISLTARIKAKEGHKFLQMAYTKDNGASWSYVRKGNNYFTYDESTDTYTYYFRGFIWIEDFENNNNRAVKIKGQCTKDTVTTIYSEDDLRSFAERVNSGETFIGETVKLANDITLTRPWTEPIGADAAHIFSGTFDGCGYTISGLDIKYTFTDPDAEDSWQGKAKGRAFGLFGYIESAEIKGLNVSGNIAIDNIAYDFEYTRYGGQSYIGGIAGYAAGSAFSDCVNEVDITAHGGYIGGIAGYTGYVNGEKNSFTDCFNYGSIDVTRRNTSACGITSGRSVNYILRCGNYGEITIGGTDVKTIVGSSQDSGSAEVTVRPDPTGTGTAAGIAQLCDDVRECFNKAKISGRALYISGLISGSDGGGRYDRKITDSYNAGALELPIDHYDHVAPDVVIATVTGVAGPMYGTLTLTNCYNTGSIISQATKHGKTDDLYAIVDPYNEGRETVSVENCHRSDEEQLKAADLNTGDTAVWKDDTANVNGGRPLLMWEASEGSNEKYDVSFNMGDVKGSVTVYSDAAKTQVVDPVDGKYSLKAGMYYYTAVAAGYEDVNGSFTVLRKAVTVNVAFKEITDVAVTVSPADAELKITTLGGDAVQPKSHNGGSYVFTLYKGESYIYTVNATGYNGKTQTFVADGKPVTITLTNSSWSGGETGDHAIYGSYTGKNSVITEGGTYNIQMGSVKSQGWITIKTDQEVTLVGKGYSDDDMYRDLYIKCESAGAKLTLQDVYIHNDLNCDNRSQMGGIIDFTGKGNKLTISGTNILDWNGNASGYAAIHVDSNTDLTVSADDGDTLYLYKHEQGAGIGGNGGASGNEGKTPEANGEITFTGDGTYFIKSSKQGAAIGTGADSYPKKPADIRIKGGTFYIIANSRAAAIGGSAGDRASAGGNVYIGDNASVTINVDYSGAAIGGGGHASGNDADGGTLYYGSGSVRTYIDTNAVPYWDVSRAGINGNKAVTANVVSSSGNRPLYLLELDTSKLTKSASRFTVKEGSSTIYSGRLHEYRSINEGLDKKYQEEVTYTMDNWTSLDDSQLYLYMTGADHTLDVNGETVTAKWDASEKTFTLTYPDGTTGTGGNSGSGSLAGDDTPLVSETIKPDVSVSGSNAKADVKKDAVDGAVKAVGNSSNAQIAIDAVSGKSGVTRSEVSLPMESVKNIQKDTKADIVIKTDLGDITIDNSDLSSLTTGSGSDVKFTIDKNADGSMKVGIASGSKDLAAGREIVKFKYKIDDAIMKSLGGKTGVGNSDLAGAVVGAKGADGKAQLDIMRDSYVTADGYLITYAPVGGAVTVTANGRDFGDVAANAWYAKAVGFAVSHELFNGVSDNEFAPSKSMTRGMFVTVLNRLAEAEDFSGKTDFTDVASDKWYATGTAWAASKGIVSGYGDGKFGPDDKVTREQMAVIMYNFTKAMGYDVKGSASLAKFSDSASVHSWASEAMQWAVGAGVMSGNADGTLNPRGTATRAQVATIMMNYVQVLLGAK